MSDSSMSVISYTQGAEFLKKLEQAGLTKGLAQEVIVSPGNLKARKIIGFLTGDEDPFNFPEVPATDVEAWKVLYKAFFGIELDASKLKLPKEKEGFNQLIIVPEGLKIQQAYEVLDDLFPYWKYTEDNLDEIVTKNDREPKATYAIRVRDRVEADEEFKNLSANDLEKKGHAGMTLLERLLLGLFHFWKTGEHLDKENVTLCAGSRYSDGYVPSVYWDDNRLRVGWCNPANAYSNLRSREVLTV